MSEIRADNVLAFPTSPRDNDGQPVSPENKKIRLRDIWDIAWLSSQKTKRDPSLMNYSNQVAKRLDGVSQGVSSAAVSS